MKTKTQKLIAEYGEEWSANEYLREKEQRDIAHECLCQSVDYRQPLYLVRALLRREAARACLLSRRFEDGSLEHWYEGRYLAYKQSAALLEIALEHDD